MQDKIPDKEIPKGRIENTYGWHIFLGLTITYTRIIATIIIAAGLAYAFVFHEAGGAAGIITAGVGLFIGRSAVDKFGNPNPFEHMLSGGEHELVLRKPQPRNVVEKGNSK